MGRLKKLKKIRIHREGTHILWASFLLLLLINAALYWGIDCKIPFYVVAVRLPVQRFISPDPFHTERKRT